MTSFDDLRPASFRGAPFEVFSSTMRGGQRGAHHVYPLRDQGWVEQLGLSDRAVTLDAIIIGDDVADRTQALIEALEGEGAGELIHPWLGSMQVVLDPNAGFHVRQSFRRGRATSIQISFLKAPADGTFPTSDADGAAKTANAADAAEEAALELFGGRIRIAGVSGAIEDLSGAFEAAFEGIDTARAIVRRATSTVTLAEAVVRGGIAAGRALVRDFLAIADIPSSIVTIFDTVAFEIGTRRRSISDVTGAPGARPVAVPPRVDARTGAEASSAAIGARANLDGLAAPAAPTDPRLANAQALAAALEVCTLSELARAYVEQPFDSHNAAIEAMRDLEARVETAIRRESVQADPDDGLMAALTDMRAEARDALLTRAADLIPIANLRVDRSLPSLALAWRISGRIDDAADLVARNNVAHPLWMPAEFDYRERADV
ncbi:MAG: DNA circularization N-terminal domain-containing protein [Pseudomonadota bacterium]